MMGYFAPRARATPAPYAVDVPDRDAGSRNAGSGNARPGDAESGDADTDAATSGTATSGTATSGTARDLLGRWLSLSELERRAFVAMTREIAASSAVVESSAIDLSERFRVLAESAHAQMGRVERVIGVARCIQVDGAQVTLSEATGFIENVLVKVIDTVLMVSKNAMRMVYSLDVVGREVEDARKSLSRLHGINQQTRFLALNAAIEAARSDRNGGPFEVIAREIRELSKETDLAAKEINGRIAGVSNSVRHSHDVLREIATVDMSEHIIAKERLNALLTGMLAQSEAFNAILRETAGASEDISAAVAPLVMGLQFQDRTAQQLAHVIEALGTLGQATEALGRQTHDAMPGAFAKGEIDRDLLDRIIDKQTLGAVRARFVAQLLGDETGAGEATGDAAGDATGDAMANGNAEGGDIDLF